MVTSNNKVHNQTPHISNHNSDLSCYSSHGSKGLSHDAGISCRFSGTCEPHQELHRNFRQKRNHQNQHQRRNHTQNLQGRRERHYAGTDYAVGDIEHRAGNRRRGNTSLGAREERDVSSGHRRHPDSGD